MIAWYLMSVLVHWSVAVALESHLVDGTADCLGVADITLAVSPPRFSKKVMLLGVHGDRDWVVLKGCAEVIPCPLSQGPFDKNLPTALHLCIPAVVVQSDKTVEVILVQVTIAPFQHLVVRHDLLKDLVTDSALEFP